MTSKGVKAIAVFTDEIKGTVRFTELGSKVKIDVSINGLKPNSLHGFHVHEAGDLTDKCQSMCAHFNPYNLTHGCPGMKNRHVGDLGNLHTNNKGEAKYTFYDDFIKLTNADTKLFPKIEEHIIYEEYISQLYWDKEKLSLNITELVDCNGQRYIDKCVPLLKSKIINKYINLIFDINRFIK